VIARDRSSRLSFAVLAAGAVATALYCYYISHKRIFWSDEMFGWMLNTDPSWRHMLYAWREGADGGGLAFYIFGRFWLAVFGKTALSFRMYSAAGCFLGFAATWFALRRFYEARYLIVSLFVVWFGSDVILFQLAQTRFYGLLLGSAAVAFYAAVRSAQDVDVEGKQRGVTLVAVFLANFLLVESHPFGMPYGAVILIGSAVADWIAKRRRWSFYAMAIATWPFLIYSREAIISSGKVTKPWFWTTKPTLHQLQLFYTPAVMEWLPYAVVLLLCLAVPFAAYRSRLSEAIRERNAIVVPGFALFVSPVAIWLISQHGTSYFTERYLIPMTIGAAVLLTEAFTEFFTAQPIAEQRGSKLAFATVAAFLLLSTAREAISRYPNDLGIPPFDFTPRLEALLPRGMPIVFERFDVFDLLVAKPHPADQPYLYLVDWPIALAPDTPRGIVSSVHLMENWRKVGYFADSIKNSDEFLVKTDRFVVVHYDPLRWFDHRILEQPQWKTTQIGEMKDRDWPATIWLVERHVAGGTN
jgi:hypothetical protein